MHFRTLVARTVAVAVACAGIAYVAAPAQAAQKPSHCVVDVSAASPAPACHASLRAALARAGAVVYIGWEDANFQGSSLTFTAPGGCTGTVEDIDYSVPSLGDWTIGSYRTYSGCWARHYELPDFGGRSTQWNGGLDFDARSFQLS